MSTSTVPAPRAKLRFWAPWAAIALVAVVLGLLLPQLMPGEMAVDKSRSKTEAKSKANADYAAPTIPDAPNPQALLARLAMGTVLVLGLSVASIWGMRRWLYPMGTGAAGLREMRLIETLPLGNRCSLHLVYLGKREVLVGVDGGGIKSIVPLAKPFDDVLGETETAAPTPETIPFPRQTA
jgi:flagellar biogenesis protein FliO